MGRDRTGADRVLPNNGAWRWQTNATAAVATPRNARSGRRDTMGPAAASERNGSAGSNTLRAARALAERPWPLNHRSGSLDEGGQASQTRRLLATLETRANSGRGRVHLKWTAGQHARDRRAGTGAGPGRRSPAWTTLTAVSGSFESAGYAGTGRAVGDFRWFRSRRASSKGKGDTPAPFDQHPQPARQIRGGFVWNVSASRSVRRRRVV